MAAGEGDSELVASAPDPDLDPSVESSLGPDRSLDRRLSDSNRTWLGKIVDGRYRVLDLIGRGGMGVVYRVEHLRMGKVAAMKVLHPDLATDPDVVARFEREAAAISKLHHPHTVQVFDFGTTGGALYLIMEFVRGLDLARLLERDGPMPWARAAPIFAQICGALQEAHELGIVHRDLKPENVLITRSTAGREYAKVLDFGLAKLDQRGAARTETDRQIVGTPYFMAPEQIRGDEVDARTDIYSLGVLMFQVLTGQHLYRGATSIGVLTQHLTSEPDAPSVRAPTLGIPREVDRLCRRALAREPAQRWQSAQRLGEAIEQVFHDTVDDPHTPRGRTKPVAGTLSTFFLDANEEPHQGSEVRLRRSDLDAYEHGLRRRRTALGTTLVVGALAAIGGAAYYLSRPARPVTLEREPNDDPGHANRIAIGAPVTGYLGKRLGPRDSDRDVFVVPSTGKRRVLSIALLGPPNLDVSFTVRGSDGAVRATVDEAGLGGSEAIHRRMLDGEVEISVRESVPATQPFVIENVSDPYTLTVTEERADTGEIEPNNADADATPLAPGVELRGYLDTRDDVDQLRFTGATGTYSVVVQGADLPLQWQPDGDKPRTPGSARLELRMGQVIRIRRTGPPAPPPAPLVGRDAPWSIVVVP